MPTGAVVSAAIPRPWAKKSSHDITAGPGAGPWRAKEITGTGDSSSSRRASTAALTKAARTGFSRRVSQPEAGVVEGTLTAPTRPMATSRSEVAGCWGPLSPLARPHPSARRARPQPGCPRAPGPLPACVRALDEVVVADRARATAQAEKLLVTVRSGGAGSLIAGELESRKELAVERIGAGTGRFGRRNRRRSASMGPE